MPTRRDQARFSQTPVRPASDDEVIVGAYARRMRRRSLAIGATGALLIALALWSYDALRPDLPPAPADTVPVVVGCQACGQETTAQLAPTAPIPIDCPKCGARASGEVWRCQACDARFIATRAGPERQCHECGSLRVGAATAPAEEDGRRTIAP